MIGDPENESDLVFGARQAHDTCSLLYNMIEDSDLAKRARSLELTWDETPPEVPRLVVPVFETRKLLSEIITRQDKGEWLGWAWPRLTQHLRGELDCFWGRATGREPDAQLQLQFLAYHLSCSDRSRCA